MFQLEFAVSFQTDRMSQKLTLKTQENLNDVFRFQDLKETYVIG